MVQILEETLAATKTPIRALVISNPHNPLGRCYSHETLLGIAEFCSNNKIHLISDEVFGLSVFSSRDLQGAPDFTSVLALDKKVIPEDLVHVVWSVSKDLALSGSRLVCPMDVHQCVLTRLGHSRHEERNTS